VNFSCCYKEAKWKEIDADTQRRIEFDDITQKYYSTKSSDGKGRLLMLGSGVSLE
jgi:hypothetical protein